MAYVKVKTTTKTTKTRTHKGSAAGAKKSGGSRKGC